MTPVQEALYYTIAAESYMSLYKRTMEANRERLGEAYTQLQARRLQLTAVRDRLASQLKDGQLVRVKRVIERTDFPGVTPGEALALSILLMERVLHMVIDRKILFLVRMQLGMLNKLAATPTPNELFVDNQEAEAAHRHMTALVKGL